MSHRIMPFGLIASGVNGESSFNLSSSGTTSLNRSVRSALKRRVLNRGGCKKTEGCVNQINNKSYSFIFI